MPSSFICRSANILWPTHHIAGILFDRKFLLYVLRNHLQDPQSSLPIYRQLIDEEIGLVPGDRGIFQYGKRSGYIDPLDS